MNWRFTRPGEVRFEAGEAIAHFFPVRRDLFERVTPQIQSLQADPKAMKQLELWRRSRAEFAGRLKVGDEQAAEEKWQKGYYRGLYPDGAKGPADHKIKIRVKDFTATETSTKKRRR